MQRLAEYRRHAGQCRARARIMSPKEHRDRLLTMADAWDRLAQERERYLERQRQPGAARPPSSPRTFLAATPSPRGLDTSKRSRPALPTHSAHSSL